MKKRVLHRSVALFFTLIYMLSSAFSLVSAEGLVDELLFEQEHAIQSTPEQAAGDGYMHTAGDVVIDDNGSTSQDSTSDWYDNSAWDGGYDMGTSFYSSDVGWVENYWLQPVAAGEALTIAIPAAVYVNGYENYTNINYENTIVPYNPYTTDFAYYNQYLKEYISWMYVTLDTPVNDGSSPLVCDSLYYTEVPLIDGDFNQGFAVFNNLRVREDAAPGNYILNFTVKWQTPGDAYERTTNLWTELVVLPGAQQEGIQFTDDDFNSGEGIFGNADSQAVIESDPNSGVKLPEFSDYGLEFEQAAEDASDLNIPSEADYGLALSTQNAEAPAEEKADGSAIVAEILTAEETPSSLTVEFGPTPQVDSASPMQLTEKSPEEVLDSYDRMLDGEEVAGSTPDFGAFGYSDEKNAALMESFNQVQIEDMTSDSQTVDFSQEEGAESPAADDEEEAPADEDAIPDAEEGSLEDAEDVTEDDPANDDDSLQDPVEPEETDETEPTDDGDETDLPAFEDIQDDASEGEDIADEPDADPDTDASEEQPSAEDGDPEEILDIDSPEIALEGEETLPEGLTLDALEADPDIEILDLDDAGAALDADATEDIEEDADLEDDDDITDIEDDGIELEYAIDSTARAAAGEVALRPVHLGQMEPGVEVTLPVAVEIAVEDGVWASNMDEEQAYEFHHQEEGASYAQDVPKNVEGMTLMLDAAQFEDESFPLTLAEGASLEMLSIINGGINHGYARFGGLTIREGAEAGVYPVMVNAAWKTANSDEMEQAVLACELSLGDVILSIEDDGLMTDELPDELVIEDGDVPLAGPSMLTLTDVDLDTVEVGQKVELPIAARLTLNDGVWVSNETAEVPDMGAETEDGLIMEDGEPLEQEEAYEQALPSSLAYLSVALDLSQLDDEAFPFELDADAQTEQAIVSDGVNYGYAVLSGLVVKDDAEAGTYPVTFNVSLKNADAAEATVLSLSSAVSLGEVYAGEEDDCICCVHCTECYDENEKRLPGPCACIDVDGNYLGCKCDCPILVYPGDALYPAQLLGAASAEQAEAETVTEPAAIEAGENELDEGLIFEESEQADAGESATGLVTAAVDPSTLTAEELQAMGVYGVEPDGGVWVDCGCDCHGLPEAMNITPLNASTMYWYDGSNPRFPEAGMVVFSQAELREVLTRWSTAATYQPYGNLASRVVYFGCPDTAVTQAQRDAVFMMTGTAGIGIHASINTVKLIGYDPVEEIQMLYTGWDVSAAAGTIYRLSAGVHIIWQDVKAVSRNSHGLTCGQSYANQRVEFIRCDVGGIEVCHNEGASTLTIFEDCTVNLYATSASKYSEKWAHCQDIIIQGGQTTVNKEDCSAAAATRDIFQFSGGTTCSMTIKAGASLVISATPNEVDFMTTQLSTSKPSLILEAGASLLVDMPGKFSNRQLESIIIPNGASVTTNPNSLNLANSGAYIMTNTMNVDGILNANYVYASSASTTDTAVKAAGTLTVGPNGKVQIEQHGGIGSALDAPGLSFEGEVNVIYNPNNTAAATQPALNIGTSSLNVVQGGKLIIDHRNGGGSGITAMNLNCEGLIDITYTPSFGANHAVSCTGNVTVADTGVFKITQAPNGSITDVGGNALNIPSTSATINVLGTFEINQTAGSNTIGSNATSSSIAITGGGNFTVIKDGYARDCVIKTGTGTAAGAMGTLTLQTNFQFTQRAGGNSIETSTLRVNDGVKLAVTKTGASTGAIVAGSSNTGASGGVNVELSTNGEVEFEQLVGNATVDYLKRFAVMSGAKATINRTAAGNYPVFSFNAYNALTGVRANGLYLQLPDYVSITNTNGAMIGGISGYAGGVRGTTSTVMYQTGANAYQWNRNLIYDDPIMDFDVTVLDGAYSAITTNIENSDSGAKPDERPLNATNFNITSSAFTRFRAGSIGTVTMAPVYKGDTTVTGTSAPSDVTLKAIEYTMPNSVYAPSGNASTTVAGTSPYSLAMNQISLLNLGRVYLEVKRSNGLEGYGYRESLGQVSIDAQNLLFENTGISFHDTVLKRQDTNWKVTVTDTRGYYQNSIWNGLSWDLKVTIADVFKENGTGPSQLTNSRVILKPTAASTTTLDPGTLVLVDSSSSVATGYEDVFWADQDLGFLFNQKSGEGESDKEYKAQMNWELHII